MEAIHAKQDSEESGHPAEDRKGVRAGGQTPEVKVLRVQNPQAFELPYLSDLLNAALDSSRLAGEGAREEVLSRVTDPRFGLFVGRQGDEYKALAIAMYSPSALAPGCSVYQFYNKGRRPLREALIRAVVEFAREGGYDRLITADTNKRPRSFPRMFASAGKVNEVGRTYAIDTTEGRY